MSLLKPATKLDWVPGADPTKVVEPSSGKKASGWLALEKPPFQYFNWIHYIVNKWLNYLHGGHNYTYIIDTDTDIGDYTTLAGYVADSPAAGDKVLVRVDQVLSATLDIPAGVELTLAKGVTISTTTVFTPVLRFADDCKTVGELVLDTGHTGTIADGFVVNGDDNHHESVLVINSSTGTLTDAITVLSGKLRNYVNGAVTNTGGGTLTNPLNDASGNITNQVRVRDATRQYGYEPHHHLGNGAPLPFAVATGSVNVLAITLSPVCTAYAAGQVFGFKANLANTASATLNVNSLGAKTIKRWNGDNLTAGDLQLNGFYSVMYDGTNMVLINSNHGHTGVDDGGLLDTLYAALRPYKNLVLKNGGTSDEEVDIDADWAILKDTSGNPKRIDNPNYTADNTASGVNGIYTGAVAGDTFYAVWLTSGGSGTCSGLHLSDDLATVLGDAPAGYEDYGLLVGWILTDATDDFLPLYQIDNKARCRTGTWTRTIAAVASKDISAFVPPGIKRLYFNVVTNATGVYQMNPVTYTAANGNAYFHATSPAASAEANYGECPVETDQTVFESASVASTLIYPQGWELRS